MRLCVCSTALRVPRRQSPWPARPRSEAELRRIGVDLADPTLMNQIPAYATPGDANTRAYPANRVGSWRRNQLRLEAGVPEPLNGGLI